MFRLTRYLLDEYKKVGVGVTLKPSAFVAPPKPKKQREQPTRLTAPKKQTTAKQKPADKPAPPPKPKERDVVYDTTAKYALRRKN